MITIMEYQQQDAAAAREIWNEVVHEGVAFPQVVLYCTALVSLKMEAPGPFSGTRQDVLDYIREFY